MNKSRKFSEKDISLITTYQSGIAQASAHRRVNRIVTDFLLAHNLSPMQWFTLGTIYDASPAGIRLSDLARSLDTTLPYITNSINMLESKNLVGKMTHPGDSRIKIVAVNPEKIPIIQEIEAGLRERMRDELYSEDRISREELSVYIHVIYKMLNR